MEAVKVAPAAPAAAPATAPASTPAAAPASAAAPGPLADPKTTASWPKRLHKRALKALTKSSATNVDMAIFRWLYEDERGEQGASAAVDAEVLRALAPLRFATLFLSWQRRLARRAIEHPKIGCLGVVNFVVARQRWFDAQVAAAVDAGVEQVVALAAGYELRAHRCCLGLGGAGAGAGVSAAPAAAKKPLVFFEVDLPHASLKKRELIARLSPSVVAVAPSVPGHDEQQQHERGRVRYVTCDLSDPARLRPALEAAGFDASRPTLFTAEGLIYYLPGAAAAALVREVAALVVVASSAAGGGGGAPSPPSGLALDYLHSDALEAGLAAGIGGALEGSGVGGGKKKKDKKKDKKNKAAEKDGGAAAAALGGSSNSNTNRIKMPRAYEVTARSVAAKGEPFRSAVGASPLDAATWLAAASGGALSLRAHVTTTAAADKLLGPGAAAAHGVLSFYSFLVAEAAEPLPQSPAGAAAAPVSADAVARVVGGTA